VFDLRYHVASLVAVFLALLLGILVGVGISRSGLVKDSERRALNDQIERLRQDLSAERERTREQEAASAFVEAGYGAVMDGRLSSERIAVVFVGSVDDATNAAVEQTVNDAGGTVVRLRALALPAKLQVLEQSVASHRSLAAYRGPRRAPDLGRDLARELVDGGPTPLWDALAYDLVAERRGSARTPADAVVIVRSAPPQRGRMARFLEGFYSGLRSSTTVVGAETRSATPSAIAMYRREHFSSVDDVDLPTGKVALAVLLAGGRPGHYGLRPSADRIVPPIDPVPASTTSG
jgi:Copper transport outer membrane protein, MctB